MRVRLSYGVMRDAWKFLRDLVRRPHVVNLGWDACWADFDEKLLLAAFGLFERFLLEEWPAWEREDTDANIAVHNEVVRLAWWWEHVRPFRTDGVNALPVPPIEWIEGTRTTEPTTASAMARNRWEEAHRNSAILTELWYEEDTAMLHRLIAIRDQLWA